MVTSSPTKDKIENPQEWLKEAFFYAIQQVNGCHCVVHHLKQHNPWPKLDKNSGPIHVIAIGKAACAMARGAEQFFGSRIHTGLIITDRKYMEKPPLSSAFHWIEGSHPIPDHTSLTAGKKLLQRIESLPYQAKVLLLLSGGSSAMVEVLPDGVSLSSLKKMNQWLLGSGLGIHAINALRGQASEIKGGRLARYLSGKNTCCLLISDVIGDDPGSIGSGLIAINALTHLPHHKIPGGLHRTLQQASTPPALDDPCLLAVQKRIIASNSLAQQAAGDFAARDAVNSTLHTHLFNEDIRAVADNIVATLQNNPCGLHIWGGEPTIKLPATPGIGGRNQALALEVAKRIDGQKNITFLSAGTDGIDGNSPSAGAVINGETIKQAVKLGMDADSYRKTANSGGFFERLNCNVMCRPLPTGTNVMDLMLGQRHKRESKT